jgi:hypothetical protein
MTRKSQNPAKAFMKGLSELKVKDLPIVREALYGILQVNTPQGFRNYANGLVKNLDVDKARQIETLFASYGVTNPWGL